jgi:hypothetical protein
MSLSASLIFAYLQQTKFINMTTSSTSIHLANYHPDSYSQFSSMMQLCYKDSGGESASEEEMNLLSSLYPAGQILAWDGDILAGATISRIVPYNDFNKAHRQADILDLNRYEADARIGTALYGMDIFVHPQYRGRTGHILYKKLMQVIKDGNFPNFLGASILTDYSRYAHDMSLETYVEKVRTKEIRDGALSFHLNYGLTIFEVMYDFNPKDTASLGCGVALGYANPAYNPALPVCPERMPYAKINVPC